MWHNTLLLFQTVETVGYGFLFAFIFAIAHGFNRGKLFYYLV